MTSVRASDPAEGSTGAVMVQPAGPHKTKTTATSSAKRKKRARLAADRIQQSTHALFG
jgi:hypothetical protein